MLALCHFNVMAVAKLRFMPTYPKAPPITDQNPRACDSTGILTAI